MSRAQNPRWPPNSRYFNFWLFKALENISVTHVLYLFWGRIEGHLRSIRVISRSCQGRTHKLLLYASVTHVSYLTWGHKTLLYHYEKYWIAFEVNTCPFKVISWSNALKLTREENSYLCLTTATMDVLVYYICIHSKFIEI